MFRLQATARSSPPRPFQLETGQFQHIELGRVLQQIQGGRAQIAPHSHGQAGTPRHAAQQLGHCRFAVGAGDAHHRRLGGGDKQVDVPQHRHPGGNGRRHRWLVQADAGADHQATCNLQPFGGQLSQHQFRLRALLAQGR